MNVCPTQKILEFGLTLLLKVQILAIRFCGKLKSKGHVFQSPLWHLLPDFFESNFSFCMQAPCPSTSYTVTSLSSTTLMCFDPGTKVAKRPLMLNALCSSKSRRRENQGAALSANDLGSSQVRNGFLFTLQLPAVVWCFFHFLFQPLSYCCRKLKVPIRAQTKETQAGDRDYRRESKSLCKPIYYSYPLFL